MTNMNVTKVYFNLKIVNDNKNFLMTFGLLDNNFLRIINMDMKKK